MNDLDNHQKIDRTFGIFISLEIPQYGELAYRIFKILSKFVIFVQSLQPILPFVSMLVTFIIFLYRLRELCK